MLEITFLNKNTGKWVLSESLNRNLEYLHEQDI